MTYLKNLWAAICNRENIRIVEVEKKVTEIRDLSMTTADMRMVKELFPLERWKEGKTLEDFARSDGEQRVIRWFESRIGKRSETVGKTNVL